MLEQLSILHVLAPCPAGGLETVVQLLAAGQRDRGSRVRVAAVVDDAEATHPLVDSLQEAGVDVVALPLPPRAYRRERALIDTLCRRQRPSVVHTHGLRPDVLDAGVARRLGIPTITTVHGYISGTWKVRFYEYLQRLSYRRFDAVVAVSKPLAQSLADSGVRRDRIHLVPNAYQSRAHALDRNAARRSLSIPEGEFVVGWVGRLGREKGADVLVDAVARLAQLPLTVSLLGDGAERRALSMRAAALGVADRIRWHGLVREAASLFRAFDVFVLSSRTEGSPMVLFEAMAAGVPIVAANVGGVPDILSSTEALLIPPADPVALADAVRSVYSDQGGAALRANAARERLLTEFDLATWIARYDAVYRRIQRLPLGP